MKISLVLLMAATVFGFGCGSREKGPAASDDKPRPEAAGAQTVEAEPTKQGATDNVQKVIEDVSGVTSLRAGRKAQDKVLKIQEEHNRRMEQLLKDTEE